MPPSKSAKMGKVTTTITITNQIDQILAEKGYLFNGFVNVGID